jgi:hypothetical protein
MDNQTVCIDGVIEAPAKCPRICTAYMPFSVGHQVVLSSGAFEGAHNPGLYLQQMHIAVSHHEV